jgi:hypothetical protein
LTRSHHFIARDSHRGRRDLNEEIWCNLFQNVYRRSLSSTLENRKPKPPVFRETQGLRRPRFSFFIFTCQTARGPRTPLSRAESSDTLHSTAKHNRLVSAVESLIKVRSIKGANACLGLVGQCSAALSGRGYKLARSALSTVIVNKSSHHVQIFAVRKSPRFFGALRRT